MTVKHLTFIHKFSKSVQCVVRVPDEPPAQGAYLELGFKWNGRLKPKHLPVYRRWILVVNQTLADHWQKAILYGLGIHDKRTELWHFEPGQSPRLVHKLSIGIFQADGG